VSAFFFGPADRQLFGYHHEPAPELASGRAVVVCPPWGPGYEYAHRALMVLSKRLAENGRHVLRFDYSGTGDSWGGTIDADLDRWGLEAEQAMVEIRARSGCGPVDFVGLRLGALVAARAATTAASGCQVVLWDPIVNGRASLTELGCGGNEGDLVEIAGIQVSRSFHRQLEAISPADWPDRRGRRTLLLLTRESADERGAEDVAGLVEAEQLHLDQPSPWLLDPMMWTGQVPALALARIVEWLE
jgi:pimeloyl-ACP methyl ester carboxylesterase